MLSVKFRALPSPWTRALAFRTAENWLRRHYLYVTVVTLVLLILNEFYAFGTYLPAWDWLFVSGWITFLLTFKATFLLPDKVDEVLSRLAASRVLDDSNNELGDFKQGLRESARGAARVGGVIVAAALALGWIVAKRGALPFYLLTVLLEVVGAFLAGSFIGRAVSYSRLGQRLKSEGFSINVDPEYLERRRWASTYWPSVFLPVSACRCSRRLPRAVVVSNSFVWGAIWWLARRLCRASGICDSLRSPGFLLAHVVFSSCHE